MFKLFIIAIFDWFLLFRPIHSALDAQQPFQFVGLQKFENGEIINQIVGFSEGCDQNGDRVS